ncbi:MAG: sulfatase-like hydrolase/transferase [Pseudomonadota bacterium]
MQTVLPAHWKPTLTAVMAVLVLHLVLIQPNHPDAVSWWALSLFPLELPAIVLALIALKKNVAGQFFRFGLVALILVIATLKAADFGMFVSLNRGFNLVADFPLIVSLYQLILGALGPLIAALAVIAAIVGWILVAIAIWWATGRLLRVNQSSQSAICTGFFAVLFTAIAAFEVGATMAKWSSPIELPGTAFTARVGVERAEQIQETLTQLREFKSAAQADPFRGNGSYFDQLDRDIYVIFLESYGRTSFDTPLYAKTHQQTLAEAAKSLEAAGLSVASTFLTSPTQGGQSWIAHASFANGLWIDNQTSYQAALRSGRQTLFHLARQSGFETVAVMPQITLEWPEAQFMGFDKIFAAADLSYAGKPFNWVTMPDQFTYAAADRLLSTDKAVEERLFVQIATGSSHAPWVPVPRLLDWDALGDGSIFNEVVENGVSPRTIWQDNDRVREQYRRAVDYALQAAFAYVLRHADSAPLVLIIGDHQAASFVSLDDRPHVPMHVIGPERLVHLIADDSFTRGLVPSSDSEPWPMSDLRAHLIRSLSSANMSEAQR